jgi:sigma54-dependent transcription regulator
MLLSTLTEAQDTIDGRLSHFCSSAYQAALLRLVRFARDDTAPILIEGESGTGKTTLARLVHAQSPRAKGPFQNVVLSALDDGIAASELFGHVAGAFTDARRTRAGHFVSANGGTLFLDEIGKTSLRLQSKLLHALEYGEIRPVGSDREVRVNSRVVAATNIDLTQLVSTNAFLPDLRARLMAFRVTIPPLRERRTDIPGLVVESVRHHARAARRKHSRVRPPLRVGRCRQSTSSLSPTRPRATSTRRPMGDSFPRFPKFPVSFLSALVVCGFLLPRRFARAGPWSPWCNAVTVETLPSVARGRRCGFQIRASHAAHVEP